MGLEDEVGLTRDPNAIGDEMVQEDGRILLVVGLVGLALVNVGRIPWRPWRGAPAGTKAGQKATAKDASKLRGGMGTSEEVN